MRTLQLAVMAGAILSCMVMPAFADSTGSQGCAVLAQAAADGAAARIQANDAAIPKPDSVTHLSCLDGFFNGTGLNLVSNIMNPTSLLDSVKGHICQAVDSAWQNTVGSAQCGLTVNGFNIGFSGIGSGSGLMCPKLSFGGDGPPIGGINSSYRVGNGDGLYVNGSPAMPSGYTAAANAGIF
jgi:hypothetical protein